MREKQFVAGKRLTIRIAKVDDQVEVQTANRDEIPFYWGYTVLTERHSFNKFLANRKFDLTIATSKFGTKFAEVAEKIAEKWKGANSIFVGFGAPTRGLYEIARDEGTNLNAIVDFVVNTIIEQGTETVRTEEALLASLAILNVQFDC
jgi:hypothetical protein